MAFGQDMRRTVTETREKLQEWVELRRVISKEESEWAVGKEILQDQVDLLKRELESLKGKIKTVEKSIGEAEEKKGDLVKEDAGLEQSLSGLVAAVNPLEDDTRRLIPRLPLPLRERIKPLSQQLPAPGAEVAKSIAGLGRRYLTVIGLMNEINKFNREVSTGTEIREIGVGQTAEVVTLYLGIGQAYYTALDGSAAGVGHSTESSWDWKPSAAAAQAIQQAIAILNNEKPAEFVSLPLSIL